MNVTGATFYSPDTPEPVPCSIARDGPDARLTIPGDSMAMYGYAKLELGEEGGAQ